MLRRPHSFVSKLLMAAAIAGATAMVAARRFADPEPLTFTMVGTPVVGLNSATRGSAPAWRVVREAEAEGEKAEKVKRALRVWKGTSRFKTYDGFVFRRKRLPHLRIRLDRFGTGKRPFYRIKVAFQPRKQNRSGRFLESLGWWDPFKETDDPKFMKLKLDRVVFWLRWGAMPTDMVANLLDRVGIIRRTGPEAKKGEWEWRIPKNSGPEAPEGWRYDGASEVTWGNKPMINHRKGHPHTKDMGRKPIIEKFGFKGYTKIPIEGDVVTDPLTQSSLLEAFSNTELPLY